MDIFMKIEFFVIFNVLEKKFYKEKIFTHQSQTCNGLGKRFSYFLTTLYTRYDLNYLNFNLNQKSSSLVPIPGMLVLVD